MLHMAGHPSTSQCIFQEDLEIPGRLQQHQITIIYLSCPYSSSITNAYFPYIFPMLLHPDQLHCSITACSICRKDAGERTGVQNAKKNIRLASPCLRRVTLYYYAGIVFLRFVTSAYATFSAILHTPPVVYLNLKYTTSAYSLHRACCIRQGYSLGNRLSASTTTKHYVFFLRLYVQNVAYKILRLVNRL